MVKCTSTILNSISGSISNTNYRTAKNKTIILQKNKPIPKTQKTEAQINQQKKYKSLATIWKQNIAPNDTYFKINAKQQNLTNYNCYLRQHLQLLSYNPIIHYGIEEGNSTTLLDYTTNKIDAQIIGAQWEKNNKQKNTLLYNGIDNYAITQPLNTNSLIPQNNISVNMWIKFNSVPDNARGLAGIDYLFIIRKSQISEGNHIDMFIYGNNKWEGRAHTPLLPQKDEWYFLTLTYDGSILKAYNKGNIIGEQIRNAPLNKPNKPLQLARSYAGSPSHINYGFFQLYNYTLSQKQIQKIYNITKNQYAIN